MATPTTRHLVGIALAALLLPCLGLSAQEGDALLGQWLTQEGGARVEIEESDGVYSGTISWLEEPNYPAGDAEAGEPKRDRMNPDEPEQPDSDMPPTEVKVLEGFTYAGKNTWTGGTIYDPKNGKTYRGRLRLKGDQELRLRGFVGIALFGRTRIWTRYTAEPAQQAQATDNRANDEEADDEED